ncbi:T9SS type A sorting domain-containing protein [Flammeovirga agarivorans]|uniref:T9SS type A sorting domain-containing protein n=1 Tax=Flammeovirga agarivorans TaxID=2726742 RepID=A0A7X8SP95_9BACT|nr:T9SS type A sorting domain-containing protein [Flammeovirga agarivorans]NLR93849.1 T9SS type A sorting domain-containing protein [Flammeovirga agarivorans]
MQRLFIFFQLTFFTSYFAFSQENLSHFQPYNTQGDNLIHVTTADLDGVGYKDYVIAMTVEGKVIAFQRPSEITSPEADNRLWEYTDLPSLGIRIFAEELIASSKGEEIILPGTDGHLRILSSTGKLLKDKNVSTGALYTATVGKNSDGETIIMTSGVDGLVYFFNTDLELQKTVRPKTDKSGNLAGLIRHLVAGDFDGDGSDEVAVFINRRSFEGNNFLDVLDISTYTRPSYWNGDTGFISDNTTPGLGFTDKQLPFAYDIDNDGDEDIVAHWGVFHPENGVGSKEFSTMLEEDEKLTLKKYEDFAKQYLKGLLGYKNKDHITNTGKYLMQHGLPGNFTTDEAKELFTLYGDDLFLSKYNVDEKAFSIEEYTWAHSDYHFTSIARLEVRNGGYDKIVLSGPMNGDDHFYVVDVSTSDWQQQARKIAYRGAFKEVNDNLDELTNSLQQIKTEEKEENREPIWFVSSSFGGWLGWDMTADNCNIRAQAAYDEMQKWYAKIGGSKNVRLALTMNTAIYGETTQDENPKITAEGVIAFCKALANKGVYFSIIIGHGSHLYMTPETLASIYEASIVDGECYMMARSKELRTDEYFDFYTPMLDAVLEKAEAIKAKPPMIMLCAKGAIISSFSQEQGDEYFPKYRDILVPGVENSNVGVQDLSIQERVGLWMNGDVKNWGCNIIGDNLTPNRVAEWGGMRNAHVVLRQMLSQYALGAKVFRLTSVTSKENPLYTRGDVSDKEEEWTQAYQKGVLNFLKIVESGIYPHAQSPSEMKGISPVAVTLYNGTERMKEQHYKHDHELYNADIKEYVLSRLACWNAFNDVPQTDVTSYISNAKRRFDNMLPTSEGGFVTFVPHRQSVEVEGNNWCNVAYQTNGDSWDDFSLQQGREHILSELRVQKKNLDFYVDGTCFWQTLRKDNDPLTYYVMLMGNSFLTPEESLVSFKAGNTLTGSCEVIDQLSGNSLGILSSTENEIAIKIPKGVPRILRVELEQAPLEGLHENGDFEAKLINWNSDDQVMATTSAYYGVYAAELTGTGQLNSWRRVLPNTTYTLSAFARVQDIENGNAVLSIQDNDGKTIRAIEVNSENYTGYRLMFTTEEVTDSLQIVFERTKGSTGKSYLDEVVFKKTAYVLNPDFEKELSCWETQGTVNIDNSSAKIGANAKLSQWIKTASNSQYEIVFTAQLENQTLQFSVFDKDEELITKQEISSIQNNEQSIIFNTDPNSEDVKVEWSSTDSKGGNVWVDSIKIKRLGDAEYIPNQIFDDGLLLKVFPNPTKEVLTIETNDHQHKTVKIYDIMGKLIYQNDLLSELEINVSQYPKGTYVILLTDNNGENITARFIVE